MLHDPAPEKRMAIAPLPGGQAHRDAPLWDHDSTREKDPGFPHIPTSSSALPVVIGQRQRRTRRDDKASKKGNPTQPWFDQSQTRQKITCSSLFGKTEMGIPLMTPSQLCVWVSWRQGAGELPVQPWDGRNGIPRPAPASPQRHQRPMAPAGLMRGRTARYRRESAQRYLPSAVADSTA